MTAEELKKWRNKKGWSQAKAANEFGLSYGGWQKWELGTRPISEWLHIALENIDLLEAMTT